MDTKIGNGYFIGQHRAVSLIDNWIQKNDFPHFLLFVGDNGSGRRTLAYLFAKSLDAEMATISDMSVDSIRQFISAAYSIESKIVYVIPNSDKMSIAAKNSLLKLTEEPPENAYVILTLNSLDNTLPTLRSRSQHIIMEPYKFEELNQISDNDLNCKISTNPGMLITLNNLGSDKVNELLSTCDKLIDYIDRVSLSNALKSANSIKFKDSDKGFDLFLIFAGLNYVISNRLFSQTMDRYSLFKLSCWSRALSQFGYMFYRSGVNRKAIYDKMIMTIRSSIYSGREMNNNSGIG